MSNIQKIKSTRAPLKKDDEIIRIANKDLELGLTLDESIRKASYRAAIKGKGSGEELDTIFSPRKLEEIKEQYKSRKNYINDYKKAVLLNSGYVPTSNSPSKEDAVLNFSEDSPEVEFYKYDEPNKIQSNDKFISKIKTEDEQQDKLRKTQFRERANLIRKIASHYSVAAERIGYTQLAQEDGSITEQYFITSMHEGLNEDTYFSSRETKEDKFTAKIEANKAESIKVR